MRNGLHSSYLKSGLQLFFARRQIGLLAIKPSPKPQKVAETLFSHTLKTKATFGAGRLPNAQSSQREALPEIDDGQIYPAMLQQVRENMRTYKDCVLLTRVGSFYELYFEQAEKYGPLLNLTRARKRIGKGTVPMV